ncbi:MAG: hypothetical protein RML35_14365 [Chloroherpetonaceae bacterium]|nr:hypothetical protein [Chloroherpetonaceae bacterium]
MNTTQLKLVTIIAEDGLEARLVRDLKALGAKGYTIANVRGVGLHTDRTNEFEGENIRIETVVSEAVADKILERLAAHYFNQYSVIAYVERVEVVRGDRFA